MGGNFTIIPNELLELSKQGKIDCYAIAIYFAIFKHKNQKNKRCYPSIRTIAKLLKIDTKTVISRRKILKECGMLSYTSKIGVGTDYSSAVSRPTECMTPSHKTILKNNTNKQEILNSFKENKSYGPSVEQAEKNRKALDEVRQNLINKGIIK